MFQHRKTHMHIPLIFILVSTLGLSVLSVTDLDWEDKISINRGFSLFCYGLVFFTVFYHVSNNLMLRTSLGQKFIKTYKLSVADVYDISNKWVILVIVLFFFFIVMFLDKFQPSRPCFAASLASPVALIPAPETSSILLITFQKHMPGLGLHIFSMIFGPCIKSIMPNFYKSQWMVTRKKQELSFLVI